MYTSFIAIDKGVRTNERTNERVVGEQKKIFTILHGVVQGKFWFNLIFYIHLTVLIHFIIIVIE